MQPRNQGQTPKSDGRGPRASRRLRVTRCWQVERKQLRGFRCQSLIPNRISLRQGMRQRWRNGSYGETLHEEATLRPNDGRIGAPRAGGWKRPGRLRMQSRELLGEGRWRARLNGTDLEPSSDTSEPYANPYPPMLGTPGDAASVDRPASIVPRWAQPHRNIGERRQRGRHRLPRHRHAMTEAATASPGASRVLWPSGRTSHRPSVAAHLWRGVRLEP